MFNRERAKEFKKNLKKMSVNQVANYVAQVSVDYNNEIMKEVLVVLNQEFGLGKKRQQLFLDKLNERLISKMEVK